MKKVWIIIILAIVVTVGAFWRLKPAVTADTEDQFIQADGKTLMYGPDPVRLLGTNFAHIPALGAGIGSGDIDDIAITEADYIQVRADGGNHVRFGLSFNWYQDDPVHFYEVLDQQVAWARANNLWIVWNMFTTPADCYEGYSNVCDIWTDTDEQAELQAFWVDMANHYHDEPAVAGYGLLNEPNPQDPDYCTTWFNIASDIRDAVYAIAPNQLVFIASCSDPAGSFLYRDPPFGDNIVYEVHDYSPISMTHNSSLTYPGDASAWYGDCTYNQDAFRGILQSGNDPDCAIYSNLYEVYGAEWADDNNVPLYIGEWGSTSSLNGYALFHEDKAELYNEWGVSSAHYTYKHNTIETGGSNLWGIYSYPLRLDDPTKLAAVQVSWLGAIFPNYSSQAAEEPAVSTGTVTADSTRAGVAPVCSDAAPVKAPDLFQIDRIGDQAILYFAPAGGSYSSYYIGYGGQDSVTEFGTEFGLNSSSGVISWKIQHLDPRQTYSFRVRAGNGCATGEWSATLKAGSSPTRLRHYYANFIDNLLAR